mmetsp:Transcript_55961/g.163532  ORF Transcript_55961/g.163532 Transcript_55961/m.163532 type:complete len:229 (+) Transcript_55961:639-1325(+)
MPSMAAAHPGLPQARSPLRSVTRWRDSRVWMTASDDDHTSTRSCHPLSRASSSVPQQRPAFQPRSPKHGNVAPAAPFQPSRLQPLPRSSSHPKQPSQWQTSAPQHALPSEQHVAAQPADFSCSCRSCLQGPLCVKMLHPRLLQDQAAVDSAKCQVMRRLCVAHAAPRWARQWPQTGASEPPAGCAGRLVPCWAVQPRPRAASSAEARGRRRHRCGRLPLGAWCPRGWL